MKELSYDYDISCSITGYSNLVVVYVMTACYMVILNTRLMIIERGAY